MTSVRLARAWGDAVVHGCVRGTAREALRRRYASCFTDGEHVTVGLLEDAVSDGGTVKSSLVGNEGSMCVVATAYFATLKLVSYSPASSGRSHDRLVCDQGVGVSSSSGCGILSARASARTPLEDLRLGGVVAFADKQALSQALYAEETGGGKVESKQGWRCIRNPHRPFVAILSALGMPIHIGISSPLKRLLYIDFTPDPARMPDRR